MTEFTTWRSLVDGAEISAIPDSEGEHQYNFENDELTTIPDEIGTEDLAFESLNWQTGAGVGDVYVLFGGDTSATFSDDEVFDFLLDQNGTIGVWVKPTSSDEFDGIIGTDIGTDETRHFAVGVGGTDEWRVCCNIDGDTRTTGGNRQNDEWQFLAMVVEKGEEVRGYEAIPGTGYDVNNYGSTGISSDSASSWRRTPTYGEAGRDGWDGGGDLCFIDSEPLSESELQRWVDDTKRFYE